MLFSCLNCVSDPSAGQLIAQFLYQADAAVSTARETREKEKLKNGAIELDPDPGSINKLFFLFFQFKSRVRNKGMLFAVRENPHILFLFTLVRRKVPKTLLVPC